MLKKHSLRGLFFITGHMAEKLEKFPEILEMLRVHEIGYHSSSHSVRPTIFEFTDIENYEEAYRNSQERETSHINPLNGQVEGTGGIYVLRNLFSSKKIEAFRAPGLCWSPPHLEALRDLGIKFDFSSNISPKPVFHKGITFYPNPVFLQFYGNFQEYKDLLLSVFMRKITVLCSHPNLFVNQQMWDSIYWNGNPNRLTEPEPMNPEETRSLLLKFEQLLKNIKRFEKAGLIKVKPQLLEAKEKLIPKRTDVQRCYETSKQWPIQFFNYEPKFLKQHLIKFFYQLAS